MMNGKHFQEAGNNHYDARYYRGEIPSNERKRILIEILRSFIFQCQRLEIKAILMHGGLIGWHWNQKLLPWDDDIDLSFIMKDFEIMATDTFLFQGKGRYILDINPNYVTRSTRNKHHQEETEPNRIDARYIDRNTGLYIDITILVEIEEGILSTKCPHHYQIQDVLPVNLTRFEQIPLYVPHNPENVLIQEYGVGCTTNPIFKSWIFDPLLNDWSPCRTPPALGKMIPNR